MKRTIISLTVIVALLSGISLAQKDWICQGNGPKISSNLILICNISEEASDLVTRASIEQLRTHPKSVKVKSLEESGSEIGIVNSPAFILVVEYRPNLKGGNIAFKGVELSIDGNRVSNLYDLYAQFHPEYLTYFCNTEVFPAGTHTLCAEVQDQNGITSKASWQLVVPSFLEIETLERITTDNTLEWHPNWSPDGKWLAYEKQTGSGKFLNNELHLFDYETKKDTKVADFQIESAIQKEEWGKRTEYAYGSTWSLDSKKIAYVSSKSGNYDIWYADLSEGLNKIKLVQLTDNENFDGEPDLCGITDMLAFISNRRDGKSADIYIMDINRPKSEPERITTKKAMGLTPRWSPDGSYLAYTTREMPGDYDIALYETKTKKTTNLTKKNGIAEDCRPSWSPDGSKIAFYSNNSIMIAISPNWNLLKIADNVDLPETNRGPEWSPDGLKIFYETNEEFFPIYCAYIVEIEGKISVMNNLLVPISKIKTNMLYSNLNREISCHPDFNGVCFRSFKANNDDIWYAHFRKPISETRGSVSFYTNPGAWIKIRDTEIGEMPKLASPDSVKFVKDNMRAGAYKCEFVFEGKSRDSTIYIHAGQISEVNYLFHQYKGLDYGAGFRSLIFPGWGQYKHNDAFKANSLRLLILAATAGAFYFDSRLQKANESYNSASDIVRVNHYHQEVNTWEGLRNCSIGLAVGEWGLSILDALLNKPLQKKYVFEDQEEKISNKPQISTAGYYGAKNRGAIGIKVNVPKAKIFYKQNISEKMIYVGNSSRVLDPELNLMIPNLFPGNYDIRISRPNFEDRQLPVSFRAGEKKVISIALQREAKPSFIKSIGNRIVPGGHQYFIQKKRGKGVSFLLSEVTVLALAGYFNSAANSAADKYNSTYDLTKMYQYRDDARKNFVISNSLFVAGGLLYLYNIYDSIINAP